MSQVAGQRQPGPGEHQRSTPIWALGVPWAPLVRPAEGRGHVHSFGQIAERRMIKWVCIVWPAQIHTILNWTKRKVLYDGWIGDRERDAYYLLWRTTHGDFLMVCFKMANVKYLPSNNPWVKVHIRLSWFREQSQGKVYRRLPVNMWNELAGRDSGS